MCLESSRRMKPATTSSSDQFEAPYPGSKQMPQWETNELIDAPKFSWRNALGMIGPGLVLGASAIGGGEWLAGPAVTARYGGALLWVTTISILVQVIYNVEISRYTLYTGEPIFTGKFRTLPGPYFWLGAYLIFDWGSLFPYLAVNAASPLYTMITGNLPGDDAKTLLKVLGTLIYAACILPLIFGGKVYNSLKAVMWFKLIVVVGFLATLSIFYSHSSSWKEICGGFLRFGAVPVTRGEDLNGNGVLDPGEDIDSDGHLDVVEESIKPSIDKDGDGKFESWEKDADGKDIKFNDVDGDKTQDGAAVENFWNIISKKRPGALDFTLIATICGLAGIAGNGGLTNTPTSNFTRDQGWGMGHHVGAIPSLVGGHGIELSHVGSVFKVTKETLERWGHWVWHVKREQYFVWMVACFVGVALPSILSVEFLKRGTGASGWDSAVLTANGVQSHVAQPHEGTLIHSLGLSKVVYGKMIGDVFWCGTLFCGFLVLLTSCVSTMDGFIRRWVDTIWTASPHLKDMDAGAVKYVYFGVLVIYCAIGFGIIWSPVDGKTVFNYATMGYNVVFAISAWHTVAVNTFLLPKELRPSMITRVLLCVGGVYFLLLGVVAIAQQLKLI